MAHAANGRGPFPDKAGEFCGNYTPGSPACCHLNEPPAEAERRQEERLALMRFGRPSKCAAGSSEEMAAQGYVGLYLKEDAKLSAGSIPMDTDELQEDRVSKDGTPPLRQIPEKTTTP